MAGDRQTIISDIKSYVAKIGNDYSQWYVGVASDPKQRLFKDHAVQQAGGAWIYAPCASSAVAREIEDHFLARGMKGGSGGGDASSKYAYAYLITRTTKE